MSTGHATEIEQPSSVVDADELNVKPDEEVAAEIDVTPDEEVAASSKMTDNAASQPDDVHRVTSIAANATSSGADAMPVLVNESPGISAPSRKLRRKPHVEQRSRRRHSVAVNPTTKEIDEDVETRSDVDENGDANVRSREEIALRESATNEGRSAASTERSKLEDEAPSGSAIGSVAERRTRNNEEDSSGSAEDERAKLNDRVTQSAGTHKGGAASEVGSFVADPKSGRDGPVDVKKKKVKSSLRTSLERRVETVERMLEDRVERILEENVEKHPWLQPIESWIADRKPVTSGCTEMQRDADQRDRAEPTYGFKYTASTRENEEPRIEIRVTTDDRADAETRAEPKLERRVIEQLRKLRDRRAASPRRFESSAQLSKKQQEDAISARDGKENYANYAPIDPPGVLEVKEVKRYDLLDKLKDNVREKMEDIQRVESKVAQSVVILRTNKTY